VASHLSEPGIL